MTDYEQELQKKLQGWYFSKYRKMSLYQMIKHHIECVSYKTGMLRPKDMPVFKVFKEGAIVKHGKCVQGYFNKEKCELWFDTTATHEVLKHEIGHYLFDYLPIKGRLIHEYIAHWCERI